LNESDATPAPTGQRSRSHDADRDGAGLQFRAGGRVLSLFSSALHGTVLRSLSDGPVSLAELHARAGEPPPKALRGSIGNLIGLGALERRKPDGLPHLLDNELTALGRDLLCLAAVVEIWLAGAPAGPLDVEAGPAKEAVKALIAGWSSTMLRALAVRPLSFAELDGLMKAFSPSALERRLSTMRLAGQIETLHSNGDKPAYAVTDWLRHAAAPLLAAIRCERRHLAGETAPPARIDVETLFLLSVPLLQVPDAADGGCQLAVDVAADGGAAELAGVDVVVDRGQVVSCVSTLERRPGSWASGSLAGWLDAIVFGDPRSLDFGGRDGLPRAVVEALHRRLYGGPVPLL
jgi:DNA-binding HxlR family transcriptional regulator